MFVFTESDRANLEEVPLQDTKRGCCWLKTCHNSVAHCIFVLPQQWRFIAQMNDLNPAYHQLMQSFLVNVFIVFVNNQAKLYNVTSAVSEEPVMDKFH